MTVSIDDVASEVEIPPGGTLSRVLVKQGPVRLVVFAFDDGQELSEHTASVPVILQTITGAFRVEADGVATRLEPGGWLYLEAHQPHSVVAEGPARLLLTMIRCDT